MADKTIEDLLKTGRQAKQPNGGHIIIATQDINTDYSQLIKACGGECVKPGNGQAFNPFKDASPEKIEAVINSYCAFYPEEMQADIRAKLKKEIEGMRKE